MRTNTQGHNNSKLKKPSREKQDFINMTLGSISNNTQNEALISKSVDSSKNDRHTIQTFETERMNQPIMGFNQFHTFNGSNPIYTNNIER